MSTIVKARSDDGTDRATDMQQRVVRLDVRAGKNGAEAAPGSGPMTVIPMAGNRAGQPVSSSGRLRPSGGAIIGLALAMLLWLPPGLLIWEVLR